VPLLWLSAPLSMHQCLCTSVPPLHNSVPRCLSAPLSIRQCLCAPMPLSLLSAALYTSAPCLSASALFCSSVAVLRNALRMRCSSVTHLGMD
jgi:hypothetical protein